MRFPLLLFALRSVSGTETEISMRGAKVSPAGPGCGAGAQYPCLPGIDAIGIGFDAVYGTSRGVGRRIVSYSFTNSGQTWRDPFGNKTVYAYPDQATVTQKTTQFMGHSIYRSVSQYVRQQSTNAHVKVGYGPWFSASAETASAHSVMRDGLHVVAKSTCELGIYDITLDPGMLLSADPKFLQYVQALPEQYDPTAYGQFVNQYGTHFVSSATLGGKATMSTTISHDYYSTQSDSSIQAQLAVSWGLFGGGGGGGSSTKTHDATWTQNAESVTYTEGGDPAIKGFNSSAEWTQWAKSVETGSPIVTSYTLELIDSLVPDGPKRTNVQQAVAAYAAAHNATFPGADPSQYQMQWCDCYNEDMYEVGWSCPTADDWRCAKLSCRKKGWFMTDFTLNSVKNAANSYAFEQDAAAGETLTCCRPCFTASN